MAVQLPEANQERWAPLFLASAQKDFMQGTVDYRPIEVGLFSGLGLVDAAITQGTSSAENQLGGS